jgi:hypothetical protein
MFTARMDLLMKRLEDHEKLNGQEVVEAMDARMTCETYGDNGHFGDACPETHKDVNFVNNNNGYRTQENQGSNQCSNHQGGNIFNGYNNN